MKKSTIFSALLMAVMVLYTTVANAQKGEMIMHIYASQLAVIDDSNITIYSDATPILITERTIILVQYKAASKNKPLPPTRVRVFYIEEAGVKMATKIVSETILVPGFKLVKPIASYIPPTAISGIGMGKIRSWGWGVLAEARIGYGLSLFFESSKYKYSQVLVEEGSTQVHAYIGTGTTFDLPDGAKYSTETTVLRLGIKYGFLREKYFQPFIGWAYGISLCQIQYTTLDEDDVYGSASDFAWRSSLIFGVEYKRFGTISVFFEAISPVANYSVDLPKFGGTFSTFEGMTYPTPRIGISIGGF